MHFFGTSISSKYICKFTIVSHHVAIKFFALSTSFRCLKSPCILSRSPFLAESQIFSLLICFTINPLTYSSPHFFSIVHNLKMRLNIDTKFLQVRNFPVCFLKIICDDLRFEEGGGGGITVICVAK